MRSHCKVLFFTILSSFILTPIISVLPVSADVVTIAATVSISGIPPADGSRTYGALTVFMKNADDIPVRVLDTEISTPKSGETSISWTVIFENVDLESELPAPNKYRVCATYVSLTKCDPETEGYLDAKVPTDVGINFSVDKEGGVIDETGGDGTGPPETKTSCAIDGVGWIVCPVVRFLSSIADGAFTFLSNGFLSTSPKIFDTSNATYKAWQEMRNLANVAFVIAFMIIIFSQVTSVGLTNYGVKKMLPRLVIAAILVNISYFICQIAVDLSNILGFSLKNLFDGMLPAARAGASDWSTGASGVGGFLGITAGILTAGTIVWAALATLIPVLLAAVVALVMILFILVARQALIILLVIISPLAFVCFLLPNTAQLFTKWQKTFTTMLLLFPIVALVFGVSNLASGILSSVYTSDATTSKFGQILAAAVLVLPLFVVPSLLKKSLDAIPAIGQLANNLSSKANSNLKGKVGETYQNTSYARGRAIRKSAKANYLNRRYAEGLQQEGKIDAELFGAKLSGVAARGVSGLPGVSQLRGQKAQSDAVVTNAKSVVAAADAKELNEAMVTLDSEVNAAKADSLAKTGTFNNDKYLEDIATDTSGKNTDIQKKAAIHTLGRIGSADALRRLRDNAATNRVNQTNVQSAINANVGSLMPKAPDLIMGEAGAFDGITGNTMSTFKKGTAEAHMKYIEKLQADHSGLIASRASAVDIKTAETKLNTAVNSFSGAIDSIASTPALAATFSGDTGKVIFDHAATLPSSLTSKIVASIDPATNYKIHSNPPANTPTPPPNTPMPPVYF